MKNLLALLAVLVSAISLHAQVVQVVVSGSVRDAETIDFCKAHNMALVFSGVRHFKH